MHAFLSPAFRAAVEQATLASGLDARVLLTGESGTGKEVLAAYIHDNSPFSSGPFVKVPCGVIPEALVEGELFGHETRRGKFELACNGTLFLDEIGDLNASSQTKLVCALQKGEFIRVSGQQTIRVGARVVSATCHDLSRMVKAGKFREDLFRCLSVVPIRVPSLRDNPEDIVPMAEYFLEDFCFRNGSGMKWIEPAVWKAFEDYSWPGNARELRNVVERMAILSLGDSLEASDLPPELKPRWKTSSRYSIQ
jgi:DNA-binding NtrC family response regulator